MHAHLETNGYKNGQRNLYGALLWQNLYTIHITKYICGESSSILGHVHVALCLVRSKLEEFFQLQ